MSDSCCHTQGNARTCCQSGHNRTEHSPARWNGGRESRAHSCNCDRKDQA